MAQTLGSTSANNTSTLAITIILIAKFKRKYNPNVSIHWLINKLEIRIIPILTKQLEISRDDKRVLGYFNSATILLYAGCWRVLSIFTSLTVNEKNAICDPEKRNDNTKSTSKIKIRNVVTAGVMAIIVSN